MQIRCASCGKGVPVADTGVLPHDCPHCRHRPVPERLGRFRVVRLLAAGGMGEVYLGEHDELGTQVALKLLPLPPGSDGDAVRARFRREAKLTAAIAHPGVVQVLDLAADGDRLFLVLELVDGRSLRSRLRDGPLPVAEALRIAAAAAEVLGAAHARAVVHRDVKPENVMLCPDGRVRVLDFGIARALQDQEPLTRTGEILGTPEYMAPEQLLDEASAVDARADVHALGVLTYELLTQRSPFAGQNLFAALKLVESLVPPPPSSLRADVPPAIDAVVLRALAKVPSERFADGNAYAAALHTAMPAASAPPSPPTRRRLDSFVVALTVCLVLAVSSVVGFWFGTVISFGLQHAPAPVLASIFAPAIDQLLAQPTLSEQDRDWLAQNLPGFAQATTDTDLRRHGYGMLRLGAFALAVDELDRATRNGEPTARVPAAVAWHCLHTLLPDCLGLPPWFAVVDRARRDRLLGSTSDDDNSNMPPIDPLLAACRDLAHGDDAAVWQRLQPLRAQWTAEHATIALLAARRAIADPRAFAAVAAPIAAQFGDPSAQLAAATDVATAAALLRNLAAESPTAGADRWLSELLLAATTAPRADGSAPPRLRSSAELAWLQGAGPAAPFWLAAARVQQALAGAPLPADEVTRLLTLFDADYQDEAPARDLVRALLLALRTPATARVELRAAKLPDEPALLPFTAWRDADDATANALAFRLRGAPLDNAADSALAHLLAATAATDATARRAHWQQALAQPLGDATFATVVPTTAPLDELLAALQASADAPPPGFAAALRACARRGVDLGALRERFAAELTHGVH